MEKVIKTKDGKHVCPACKQAYEPECETKEDAPSQTFKAEQHITGICSAECWLDHLGTPEARREDLMEEYREEGNEPLETVDGEEAPQEAIDRLKQEQANPF